QEEVVGAALGEPHQLGAIRPEVAPGAVMELPRDPCERLLDRGGGSVLRPGVADRPGRDQGADGGEAPADHLLLVANDHAEADRLSVPVCAHAAARIASSSS